MTRRWHRATEVTLAIAGFLIGGAGSPVAADEVQGELELVFVIEEIDEKLRGLAASASSQRGVLETIAADIAETKETLESVDAGSPQGRIARADLARLYAKRYEQEVAFGRANEEDARVIVGQLERAWGLLERRLDRAFGHPGADPALDGLRTRLVRFGSQLGAVLGSLGGDDPMIQSQLRSLLRNLQKLRATPATESRTALEANYLRLARHLRQLLGRAADLVVENRDRVALAVAGLDNVEIVVTSALTADGIERLEELTAAWDVELPAFDDLLSLEVDSPSADVPDPSGRREIVDGFVKLLKQRR